MVDEHGAARGRSQHAWRTDLVADEAVDDGRLPGAGRSADDDEHGGIDVTEPRQHVVVELLHRRRRLVARLGDARQLQRQAQAAERVAQFGPRRQQLCGVDGGVRQIRKASVNMGWSLSTR